MSININPELTGFENVCALITADQTETLPVALTASTVSLGLPTVYEPGTGDNNTAVTLTAIANQGYSGSVTVNYYRPTFPNLLGPAEELSPIEVDTSLFDAGDPDPYYDDVKNRVAVALGLRADSFEFTTGIPVPVNEDDEQPVSIGPVENNLIYSGATYTIQLVAFDTDEPLDDVIEVTDLTGFTY